MCASSPLCPLPESQVAAEQALLAKGILLIFGEITEAAYEKLSDQLTLLEASGSPNIEIRFDSKGGDTLPGFLMYDLIRSYKGRSTGIVLREATSIASIILQGCGAIKIMRHAWLHIHTPTSFEPLSLASLTNSNELQDLIHGLTKCCNDMLDVYEKRTSLSREDLRSLMDEDRHLFAKEALELGFVDEII